MNRLAEHCKLVRAKLDALPPDKVAEIDKTLAIDFEEHFAFQECQVRAHVTQVISTEEAQFIYVSLGEALSSSNGGWSKGVDTATKYTVTKMVEELLQRRL